MTETTFGSVATQFIRLLNAGLPFASCCTRVNLGWVHLAYDAYNGVLRPATNREDQTITRAADALLLERSKRGK